MGSSLKEVSSNKSFGGFQKVYSHLSKETQCEMRFGIYLPPAVLADSPKKVPVLYFLSGLTCTEDNFVQKSGFQRTASHHQIVVVNPDTSPRGCDIEGEEDSYDFGSGAGFYVDATERKWTKNYRMYSYVTSELPKLIEENFPVISGKSGITGHSMGGHGALMIALRNPGKYLSASAFAPIVNPVGCPWGQKALGGYLGPDQAEWAKYDSCELAKAYTGPPLPILIDQGAGDQFLENQLFPSRFEEACKGKDTISLNLRMQEDYDHSYFFISTFIEDHLNHHAGVLNKA